jgi:hypothetical protein
MITAPARSAKTNGKELSKSSDPKKVNGYVLQAREQKVAAQRRAHEEAREEVRQAAATREKEVAAGAQAVFTVVLFEDVRERCCEGT